MVKLILVGESHISPRLKKIGPLVQSRKSRAGPAMLLSEGPFLTENEKELMSGKGMVKKPSDMLVYDLRNELSSMTIFTSQMKDINDRGYNSLTNFSVRPIESFPIRQKLHDLCSGFGVKFKGDISIENVLRDISLAVKANPAIKARGIAILDAQSKGLSAIANSWVSTSALHRLEVELMSKLSSLMQSLKHAINNNFSLNEPTKKNPRPNAASPLEGIVAEFLDGLFSQYGMSARIPGTGGNPAKNYHQNQLNLVVDTLRSKIQAEYSYSWLVNGNSKSIATLVTNTGMLHTPQILSGLKEKLGKAELLRHSPEVILTERDGDVIKRIKGVDEGIRILVLK